MSTIKFGFTTEEINNFIEKDDVFREIFKKYLMTGDLGLIDLAKKRARQLYLEKKGGTA